MGEEREGRPISQDAIERARGSFLGRGRVFPNDDRMVLNLTKLLIKSEARLKMKFSFHAHVIKKKLATPHLLI